MRTLCVLAILLGGPTGCDLLVSGKGTRSSSTPVAPAAGPAADAAPAPAAAEAPVEEYTYNPIGKRDPFRSFLAEGVRADDEVPRTPLQRFEIDQYALVGIIWGIDRPRALVEDPEKTGHVMEIGTYVGRNWGKVTQITDSEVVVTEEFQTLGGDLVVNTIRMKLPIQEDTL
jgi:type IV pilus assembly protein PilP